MRRFLVILLFLAIAATGVLGQAPRPSFDRTTFEIKHQKFVFDNGLTLLVHEDHSVGIVTVNL